MSFTYSTQRNLKRLEDHRSDANSFITFLTKIFISLPFSSLSPLVSQLFDSSKQAPARSITESCSSSSRQITSESSSRLSSHLTGADMHHPRSPKPLLQGKRKSMECNEGRRSCIDKKRHRPESTVSTARQEAKDCPPTSASFRARPTFLLPDSAPISSAGLSKSFVRIPRYRGSEQDQSSQNNFSTTTTRLSFPPPQLPLPHVTTIPSIRSKLLSRRSSRESCGGELHFTIYEDETATPKFAFLFGRTGQTSQESAPPNILREREIDLRYEEQENDRNPTRRMRSIGPTVVEEAVLRGLRRAELSHRLRAASAVSAHEISEESLQILRMMR